MGGIPAGGGPPPPARLSSRAAGDATGTPSSAVKSIVVASCCSIATSRVRAARRWSPHQSVWLRCVSRAVGYLRRARRPSTSVASSPTARSPAQQLKVFGCYLVGVAAHRTSDAGAPCASYRSRQRSATCKTELYAAVLSFTHQEPHCRESKRSSSLPAECQRYMRSSTSAAVARCKAL